MNNSRTDLGSSLEKRKRKSSFAEPLPDSGRKFFRNLSDKQKDRRTDILIESIDECVNNENQTASDGDVQLTIVGVIGFLFSRVNRKISSYNENPSKFLKLIGKNTFVCYIVDNA